MTRYLCLILGLLGVGKSAYALSPVYHLGIENHVSRSVVKPQLFPFFNLGFESEETDSTLDLNLKMSVEHPKAFALSSRNFHTTLMNEGSQPRIRYQLGRSLQSWSDADEIWGLGTFNVLDSWDRLRSFSQGLTGLFVIAETQPASFLFFVSYLSIPEVMPNVVLENNRFEFYHPQAVAAGPQTFELLNRPTPLGYHLELPNLSRILFRPSAAFSFQTQSILDPVKFRFSVGYLPLNYFPMALQASMSIPLDQIVVTLKPRILSHFVYSSDLTFQAREHWSSGASILIDRIFEENQLPSDYTTAELGTLTTISPWLKIDSVRLAYLRSFGGIGKDSGPYADPNQNLFSSRILYRNAAQVELVLEEWFFKFLHEFSVDANWIALDWKKQWNSSWSSTVGGDLVAATQTAASGGGAEFLSDLRALDRIRIGIQYVF